MKNMVIRIQKGFFETRKTILSEAALRQIEFFQIRIIPSDEPAVSAFGQGMVFRAVTKECISGQ